MLVTNDFSKKSKEMILVFSNWLVGSLLIDHKPYFLTRLFNIWDKGVKSFTASYRSPADHQTRKTKP